MTARAGRSNLTETLVAALTARIQEGSYPAGSRLPTEPELCAEHGVSRSVVREAVARLRAAGLVDPQQGRGTFVLTRPSAVPFAFPAQAPRTVADLLAVVELRIGIEAEAAALAARRRTDDDLRRLAAALADFDASAHLPARAVEADYAYHLAVARASHNPHYPALLSALGPVMILMPPSRLRCGPDDGEQPATQVTAVRAEHHAVLDAIRAGDPQTAAAAARLHLRCSADRLRRER